MERRRSSDEVLKPLKCPPELEAIPEECCGQASLSLSSLEKKNGGGDEVKEVEGHHQQLHQDHHHRNDAGGDDGKVNRFVAHPYCS